MDVFMPKRGMFQGVNERVSFGKLLVIFIVEFYLILLWSGNSISVNSLIQVLCIVVVGNIHNFNYMGKDG